MYFAFVVAFRSFLPALPCRYFMPTHVLFTCICGGKKNGRTEKNGQTALIKFKTKSEVEQALVEKTRAAAAGATDADITPVLLMPF